MFTCCLFWEFRYWHDLLPPKYTFVVTTHRSKLRKSTGLCCLPVAGSYQMIQLILFSYKACGTMGKRKRNLSCLLPITPFALLPFTSPLFSHSLDRAKKKRKRRDLTAKISVCLFVCLFIYLFICLFVCLTFCCLLLLFYGQPGKL